MDHGHRTKYNFDLEIFKGVSISHISEIAKTNVGKTSRGAFEYQVPLYNSIYLELKDYDGLKQYYNTGLLPEIEKVNNEYKRNIFVIFVIFEEQK
mgnify:CR=1 FL=1